MAHTSVILQEIDDMTEEQRWRVQVGKLLSERAFDDRKESWEDRDARANRYLTCAEYYRFWHCLDCDHRWGRYRIVCNLRGCTRCSPALRNRLVKRYLPRLADYHVMDMRHIVFTLARFKVEDLDEAAGSVLKKARAVILSMFEGGIVSAEVKEKAFGVWYLHVHALVVRRAGQSFDYTVINAAWRQLAGSYVKVKPVSDAKGALFYILGYVLKEFMAGNVTAVEYVELMIELKGRRLVRAYGCLYGGRRLQGTRGGGESVPERSDGAASSSSVSDSLEKNSIKLGVVCVKCGSDRLEYSSCLVVMWDEIVSQGYSSSETSVSGASSGGGGLDEFWEGSQEDNVVVGDPEPSADEIRRWAS